METLRAALDDRQFVVAAVQDQNLLVLAPPGSGKTRVLVNAAAQRIRQRPNSATRVLCLTFSAEAAREMRRRLREPQLQAPAHRCWVGNYHQFSAYLLRSHGHLLGWPRDAGVLVPDDSTRLIAQILRDLKLHSTRPRNVAAAISSLKGRRQSDGGLLPARTLQAVRERYDEELRRRSLRDFDDLIVHATQLLRTAPTLRAVLHDAYPYVFIDELQDTNLLQLDLLAELIGPAARAFAVADDDQMIYGWRDAHPTNVAEFVERFNVREEALTGNYRCPPRIVAAANAIIAANTRRRADLMESMVTDRQGEVLVWGARGEQAQGALVAQVVQQALDEGVAPGEIAVLAPVRFLFDPVYDALDARGISYVKLGTGEIREIPAVAVLRLCLIALAGGEVTSADLADLPGWAGDPVIDLGRVRKAIDAARALAPRTMLSTLLASLGLGSLRTPARDPRGVRLLGRMVRRAIDDTEPASTDALARTMLLEWDRLEAAALHAERAVKVMTSFLAKGMEYDIVVLPFLNDGLVPYERRGSMVDWQEARRVFYVALTRARSRVVLIRDLNRPDSQLLSVLTDRSPLPSVATRAPTTLRSLD